METAMGVHTSDKYLGFIQDIAAAVTLLLFMFMSMLMFLLKFFFFFYVNMAQIYVEIVISSP